MLSTIRQKRKACLSAYLHPYLVCKSVCVRDGHPQNFVLAMETFYS